MDYLAAIDHEQPRFGDLYDELPLWSAPFGLRLLDRVPMGVRMKILDVGAGTGFLTVELAQRCGPQSQVIAVDPWSAGMSRLRSKLDYLGLKNVVLVEQDAAELDLPDGSVDLILSNLGVNNFEDPAAVTRTLFRVAAPQASLFLTTNLVGHMAEFYEVFRQTLIDAGQSDRLAALDEHVGSRGTTDSVTALLSDAGFEVVNTDTDSFRMRFADGTALLRHYFIRLGFLQSWKSIVAEDKLRPTFEALEANLNRVAEDRGEIALTIPVAFFEARKPVG